MSGRGLVKTVSMVIGSALLAVLVLFGAVVPVSSIDNSDQLNEVLRRLDREDKHPIYTEFCQNKKCVNINVNTVLQLYPHLLVQTAEVYRPWSIFAFAMRENLKSNSDSDVCCPTARSFNNPKTMKNIHGDKREIYHTAEFSQVLPVGSCLPGGACGKCDVKTRTMTILVVDFNEERFPPVEFDQFNVPMYCTCSDKAFLRSPVAKADFARADHKEKVAVLDT